MESLKKIFILHGWTYSADKWQPFIDLLEENKFSVNLLKIPGLTEKIDLVWNLDDYVKWLDQILKNEKDVVLIGHSNGGRIALAYAAARSDNLKQLILIDSAGIYHNNLRLRLKRSIFGNAAKLGKMITNSEKLRDLLYKVARETDYKDAPLEVRQTLANLVSSDLTQALKEIRVKTILIWGKYDKATPLKDGKKMSNLLRNSKLYILDARHSPMFTNTKEVIKIILDETV